MQREVEDQGYETKHRELLGGREDKNVFQANQLFFTKTKLKRVCDQTCCFRFTNSLDCGVDRNFFSVKDSEGDELTVH